MLTIYNIIIHTIKSNIKKGAKMKKEMKVLQIRLSEEMNTKIENLTKMLGKQDKSKFVREILEEKLNSLCVEIFEKKSV